MARRVILICFIALSADLAYADALTGENLYRVSTLRAAPGNLARLVEWARERDGQEFFVMRHSQGDHWDLMIIQPVTTGKIEAAFAGIEAWIAWHEDNYALGPAYKSFAEAHRDKALYHIEMFHALAGKKDELYEQRRMENAYLAATGQVQNMIFRSIAGSDVDVFTIGFHADMEAFARPADASPDESEAAAKSAGFNDRADISYYLRSLIAGHHDTLAVPLGR